MRCFVDADDLAGALAAAREVADRVAPVAAPVRSAQQRYWKIPGQFELQLWLAPSGGEASGAFAALRETLFEKCDEIDEGELVWSKREHGPGRDLPAAWNWAWLSVVPAQEA